MSTLPKFQGTPGPWKANGTLVTFRGDTPLVDPTWFTVAFNDDDHDRMCADARAIAHLPELLDAVRDMLELSRVSPFDHQALLDTTPEQMNAIRRVEDIYLAAVQPQSETEVSE